MIFLHHSDPVWGSWSSQKTFAVGNMWWILTVGCWSMCADCRESSWPLSVIVNSGEMGWWEKNLYLWKMGEMNLCGESGRARTSLEWFGECPGEFPSQLLRVHQQAGLGMAQTCQMCCQMCFCGSLGCAGIHVEISQLGVQGCSVLSLLISHPSQASELSPQLMALLVLLWALFLNIQDVLEDSSSLPPVDLCPLESPVSCGLKPNILHPGVPCGPCLVHWVRDNIWCLSQLPKPWNATIWQNPLRQNYFHRRKKYLERNSSNSALCNLSNSSQISIQIDFQILSFQILVAVSVAIFFVAMPVIVRRVLLVC